MSNQSPGPIDDESAPFIESLLSDLEADVVTLKQERDVALEKLEVLEEKMRNLRLRYLRARRG